MAKQEIFDADQAARDVEAEYPPFGFRWAGEDRWLPNMALLSTNDGLSLSDAMQAASATTVNEDGVEEGDIKAFVALLELLDDLVDDVDTSDALRQMPGTVLAQVLTRWEAASMEAMGDLGKAPSGSSPRNRAERRSSSTSRAKAKTSGTSGSTSSGRKSAAS